ncbi:MAG: hypothetical protein WCP29_16190 [Acidobacteriota bacterium]
MRVPVRHIFACGVIVAAIVFASTNTLSANAPVAQAQADHAATPQATPPATPPAHQADATPAADTASQPASQPPAKGAHQAEDAADRQHRAATTAGADHEEAAADHGNPLIGTIARLFNFSLLVGTLFYLLRSPFAAYLAARSTQIRERLVRAADMRTAAAAEQVAIAQKMQTLPSELEALRATGATEVAAEEVRIRQAAEAERARLLDVTNREITTQLRIAERELTNTAADLAVAIASERVKSTITDADQVRLVDRYLAQVGN